MNPLLPIIATLVFVVRDGKLLLMEKMAKDCAGKLMSPGGRIEERDRLSLRRCAQRELYQECGIFSRKENLVHVGVIDFFYKDNESEIPDRSVHLYLTKNSIGNPRSTSEMRDPHWWDIKNLPWDKMMTADDEFIPQVLRGEKITLAIRYKKDGQYQVTKLQT